MKNPKDFLKLRKQLIEKEYTKLNAQQKQAVFTVNGPLLILAGAGSGKTTVLINRISYLCKYGNAYYSQDIPESISTDDISELSNCVNTSSAPSTHLLAKLAVDKADYSQILAITFTNKAANELKVRLSKALGEENLPIWAMTFHSMCVKFLRRFADRLGYGQDFTIYDTADQRRLIKDCIKTLNIDIKLISDKNSLSAISKLKNSFISAEQFKLQNQNNYYKQKLAEIYALYQKKLKDVNAMDFDDLINNSVYLLKNNPDILEYYSSKFKYILVDEYQDTNETQYMLIKLLASKYNNICVVGDDDQSIYKFRGATIENILNFEKTFPGAKIIKLEENYRSTKNILDAANAVIKNNSNRKGKVLWTKLAKGQKLQLQELLNELAEAKFIVNTITSAVSQGKKYSDFAILYRMNSQSNAIENAFALSGIPYHIVGGNRFFDRSEIRDMIAYLSIIDNPNDNVRLSRIINVPRRGIGETSMEKIQQLAERNNTSFFGIMQRIDEFPELVKIRDVVHNFTSLINEFAKKSKDPTISLVDLYYSLIDAIGYENHLKKDEQTFEDRIANVKELSSTILNYEKENPNANLRSFLEEIALYTDIDSYNKSTDAVVMMTIHSAKGLEFPCVILPGFEKGIFPNHSNEEDEEALEEERRLAYVAITRARENLTITYCLRRTLFGKTNFGAKSCFVNEIPKSLIDFKSEKPSSKSLLSFSKKPVYNDFDRLTDSNRRLNMDRSKSRLYTKYTAGDKVFHQQFGEGIIISSKNLGNDSFLTVNFEKFGIKKLLANYANLKFI